MKTFTKNLFGVAAVLAVYLTARLRMIGRRPMARVAILNRLDRDLAALQARL